MDSNSRHILMTEPPYFSDQDGTHAVTNILSSLPNQPGARFIHVNGLGCVKRPVRTNHELIGREVRDGKRTHISVYELQCYPYTVRGVDHGPRGEYNAYPEDFAMRYRLYPRFWMPQAVRGVL